MMLNIVGKRSLFFLISGAIILISIISLLVFGLKPGIEFGSGSMLRVTFTQTVGQSELEQELASLGYTNAIVQKVETPQSEGKSAFLIRTSRLASDEEELLEEALAATFGDFEEASFTSVSPMVAAETASNAAIAVAVAAVGILLYITWAFRRMPSPFRYGTCAIIALLHDVLIVLGIFSILGGIMAWEINLMFITGVLAVIGYSVNNTVVVFDRVRENLKKGISPYFTTVVNSSLVETLSRSLNTSLTTLFVVLALLIFVGVSIQNFAVVLLIGIIAGTFSSICIAPLLLVVWERRGHSTNQARA
jgi:preprotein translocase subunit SecF